MSLMFATQIHFQRPKTLTILEPNRQPLAICIFFVASRCCQRSDPFDAWHMSLSLSLSLSLSISLSLSLSHSLPLALSLSLSLSLSRSLALSLSRSLSLSQSSRLLVTKATARAVVTSPVATSDPLASPTMVTPTLHHAPQTLWRGNNFKRYST